MTRFLFAAILSLCGWVFVALSMIVCLCEGSNVWQGRQIRTPVVVSPFCKSNIKNTNIFRDRHYVRRSYHHICICYRRVSSQHGRNDGGGVELRKPRKEEVVPSEEDRHKYIFDGTEYSRRPNLFDVGGGELKLLPEVLSDLNFEARNFVDSKSDREQKDLRDSRPWGRVYLDGWPAPIQYLRSHFGGPATIGMQRFVLASPLDACEPLRNAQSAGIANHIESMQGDHHCTARTAFRFRPSYLEFRLAKKRTVYHGNEHEETLVGTTGEKLVRSHLVCIVRLRKRYSCLLS